MTLGIRRCNVDMLKLIQLGLTFTDQEGNLPLIGNHAASAVQLQGVQLEG